MFLRAKDLLRSALAAAGVPASYADPLWLGLKLLLLLLVARALWRWWQRRSRPGPAHLNFGDAPDHYQR